MCSLLCCIPLKKYMCPLGGQTENKLSLKAMCFPFNFQLNNEFISFAGQNNKGIHDIFGETDKIGTEY